MQTLSFAVDGMGCRRCVREVTARLRDVPGVETLAVDVAHSVVRVSGTMSLDDAMSAFVGLDYAVRVVATPSEAPGAELPGS